jgi:hypothetical protein
MIIHTLIPVYVLSLLPRGVCQSNASTATLTAVSYSCSQLLRQMAQNCQTWLRFGTFLLFTVVLCCYWVLQVSKALGPVATVIVRKGTLKPGDPIVVGTEHGRVRALRDSRNITLGNAGELLI